jgi:hypothetical protein
LQFIVKKIARIKEDILEAWHKKQSTVTANRQKHILQKSPPDNLSDGDGNCTERPLRRSVKIAYPTGRQVIG